MRDQRVRLNSRPISLLAHHMKLPFWGGKSRSSRNEIPRSFSERFSWCLCASWTSFLSFFWIKIMQRQFKFTSRHLFFSYYKSWLLQLLPSYVQWATNIFPLATWCLITFFVFWYFSLFACGFQPFFSACAITGELTWQCLSIFFLLFESGQKSVHCASFDSATKSD